MGRREFCDKIKMRKQIVTQEDYHFLKDVISLEIAFISSVLNPLVVRTVGEGADFEMADHAGIFYYACQDEAKATATVRKRLEHADDLREHVFHHQQVANLLFEMDKATLNDDRAVFSENTEEMCEQAREYIELIRQHQERLNGGSFLTYPTYFGASVFQIVGGPPTIEAYLFNRAQNLEGALIDIDKIGDHLLEFKIRPETIPHPNFYKTQYTPEAGVFEKRYQDNLQVLRAQLKHLGLELD